MFFIQMSGFPGSGKSTLAKEIARRTGCIIVDHDVTKSALLNGIEIDNKHAGKVSYDIDFAYVDYYLSQGRSVILDSPCLYEELVNRGIAVCERYGVSYKYIECYLDDFEEINRRLESRIPMKSQIKEVVSRDVFYQTIKNSKKPNDGEILLINTNEPLKNYIEEVIQFIIKPLENSFAT